MADLGFHHRWEPGDPGSPTVLALHGTGGTEDDLVPLARSLAPGAGVLAPRGNVVEQGQARFFRRLAIGVFDERDVRRAAAQLEAFVREAAPVHGFAPERVFALGYSNGANVAAALLLLHPRTLAGAALLRAVLPLEPPPALSLESRPVFIAAADADPYAPAPRIEALAERLRAAGAEVELRWERAGHELTPADLAAARAWFARHVTVGA